MVNKLYVHPLTIRRGTFRRVFAACGTVGTRSRAIRSSTGPMIESGAAPPMVDALRSVRRCMSPLPQSSSSSSSFSSSTSLHASGVNPVGSIDYGFFDHKTAYRRPRTRTTTSPRTIREAEGSKQESHPVKILYSHTVYIQFQASLPAPAKWLGPITPR